MLEGGKKDSSRYNQNVDLDYIGGSCLLCKKRVIKEIGLLDPKFFLYWEETDWCFRGLDAGYKCRYVYKSKIWHKGLESNASCISTYYFVRNMFYFMSKHAKKNSYLVFLPYNFYLNSPKKIVVILYKRRYKYLHYFLKRGN